jgi:hypothetical protein
MVEAIDIWPAAEDEVQSFGAAHVGVALGGNRYAGRFGFLTSQPLTADS